MAIDTSGVLQNFLNSKITALLVSKLYGKAGIPSVAVPDSTRKPFLSVMRADSRVALQGAQNMEDAAALVEVAQSDVTDIKNTLIHMREKAIEMATKNYLKPSDYTSANQTLQILARHIVETAENSSFNGIYLMDGTAGMDEDGKIVLQAGDSSKDQVMENMLDSTVTAGEVIDGTKINVSNFTNLLATGGAWEVKDEASAKNLWNKLNDIIDRVELVESRYSTDYKSLKNTALLLHYQSDVVENLYKKHYETLASEQKDSSASDNAPSSALMDMLGGNIMSAVS